MHTTAIDLGSLGLRPGPAWLAGQVPPGPRLAIVGSRAARRHLAAAIPSLIEAASLAGWSIVSGGALGIDGQAHRHALLQGAPQLAVLPLGPDRLYPPDHVPLFEAMLRSGPNGLLFGQPPGTAPARGMFASRNALVVQLSSAVVVVQAGLRSGSLGTGRLALKAGCPTAAVVGSPGAAALIERGALSLSFEPHTPAVLRDRVQAWLSDPDASVEATWPEPLAFVKTRLVELERSWVGIDDFEDPIAAAAGLVEAETLGLLVECGPGRWSRSG